MTALRCRNCGSTNMRADRALAGRLVCNQCGYLIGSKLVNKNSTVRRSFSFRGFNVPFTIAILIIICFIIL